VQPIRLHRLSDLRVGQIGRPKLKLEVPKVLGCEASPAGLCQILSDLCVQVVPERGLLLGLLVGRYRPSLLTLTPAMTTTVPSFQNELCFQYQ
jgi:hypothetical protein